MAIEWFRRTDHGLSKMVALQDAKPNKERHSIPVTRAARAGSLRRSTAIARSDRGGSTSAAAPPETRALYLTYPTMRGYSTHYAPHVRHLRNRRFVGFANSGALARFWRRLLQRSDVSHAPEPHVAAGLTEISLP